MAFRRLLTIEKRNWKSRDFKSTSRGTNGLPVWEYSLLNPPDGEDKALSIINRIGRKGGFEGTKEQKISGRRREKRVSILSLEPRMMIPSNSRTLCSKYF